MSESIRSGSVELFLPDNRLTIEETHLEETCDDDDREQAEHAPSFPSTPPPETPFPRPAPSPSA